jgi:hypothetical protein
MRLGIGGPYGVTNTNRAGVFKSRAYSAALAVMCVGWLNDNNFVLHNSHPQVDTSASVTPVRLI